MPITFRPASHQARRVPRTYGPKNADELLQYVAEDIHSQSAEILQTSFEDEFRQPGGVIPQYNGFVRTIVEAYSRHYALVIRPDDVWIAIIVYARISPTMAVLRGSLTRL